MSSWALGSFIVGHDWLGCTGRHLAHNAPVPRITDPPCPCRQRETAPLRYADCCGRWHEGLSRGEHAPTPEALMRSRYSAYALAQATRVAPRGLLDYLAHTWHPSTAPRPLQLGPLKWTGLEVLRHEASGDAGVVEFVAHHKVNGRAARLHEVSRFVREAGAWLYVEGVVAAE
jgi:SEC-C motif-containing protein